MFNAGIDTIFNVDILRLEQNGSLIDGPISELLKDTPIAVVQSLPRLFASYVETIRRFRGTLFGQGSNQAPGTSLIHARSAAVKFYASCEALLAKAGDGEIVWQTRLALLNTTDEQTLYSVNDEDVGYVLREVGETAVVALLKAIQGMASLTLST